MLLIYLPPPLNRRSDRGVSSQEKGLGAPSEHHGDGHGRGKGEKVRILPIATIITVITTTIIYHNYYYYTNMLCALERPIVTLTLPLYHTYSPPL